MLKFIQDKIESDKGFARIESLDVFAQQFRNAPDLSTIYADLKEKASSLTEEAEKTAGDLYVKYGQKGIDKVIIDHSIYKRSTITCWEHWI